jgi:hypothetical protein
MKMKLGNGSCLISSPLFMTASEEDSPMTPGARETRVDETFSESLYVNGRSTTTGLVENNVQAEEDDEEVDNGRDDEDD